MIYAISRGLSDIEELEKVETEKAIRSIQTGPSDFERQQVRSPLTMVRPANSFNKWLLLSDFALFLKLFVDLEILENVETPLDT